MITGEKSKALYADARMTSQDMLLECQRLSNKCHGDTELLAALNVMTSVIQVFSRLSADKLLAERQLTDEPKKSLAPGSD